MSVSSIVAPAAFLALGLMSTSGFLMPKCASCVPSSATASGPCTYLTGATMIFKAMRVLLRGLSRAYSCLTISTDVTWNKGMTRSWSPSNAMVNKLSAIW